MTEEKEKKSGSGSLTSESLEADDVLAGAEPWDPAETQLVVWSFVVAAVALVVGLFIVPTSILH